MQEREFFVYLRSRKGACLLFVDPDMGEKLPMLLRIRMEEEGAVDRLRPDRNATKGGVP